MFDTKRKFGTHTELNEKADKNRIRFISREDYQSNMSKDEVEGRGKKIKGQIREEVGNITDNKTEQLKGKIEQVEGKVQEEIGKVKRKARG